MPTSKDMRLALKAERAKSGAQALKEHEAEKRAIAAKTERLRALRLAKEAEEALVQSQQEPVKRRPNVRAKRPR